ncbi:MAG: winged helix-turn-helix domain-containing protein [Novosphingobium sp.]
MVRLTDCPHPDLSKLQRATTILVGCEDSSLRAHYLSIGYGEALSARIGLEELDQRARRLSDAVDTLPSLRRHGPLVLDLLSRDGLVSDRRLGLHPREFSLLWRLAETPGKVVAAEELLAEVWKMTFRPETNSLAVHVCRLRAKLASAGLSGIVCTAPNGGYSLAPERGGPDPLARRLAAEDDAGQIASRSLQGKFADET